MTTPDTFGRDLSRWLHGDAEHRVPDHLGEVLVRTAATRQRRWWSSLERWISMETVAVGRPLNLRPVAILLLVIGALVLAASAALWVASQRQSPSFGLAENGRIFVADNQAIKSFAADGTDAQIALHLPANASTPSMSADGRSVAYFMEALDPPRVDVFDVEAGTTTTIPTPGAAGIGGPITWSPDGSKLLFNTFDGTNEHLIIANADGSSTQEIDVRSIVSPSTGSGHTELWPVGWAPTGDRVAFVGRHSGFDTGTLYVVRPDGSDLQRLDTSQVALGDANDVSWSPDPAVEQLVFVTGIGALSTRVFDVAAHTEYDAGLEFWPTWSPDGKKIAGCCAEVVDIEDVLAGEPNVTEVFTSADGYCKDFPELSGQAVCSRAVWSPDGKSLLASDIIGNGILIAPIDGSAPPERVETDAKTGIYPSFAWQPIRD